MTASPFCFDINQELKFMWTILSIKPMIINAYKFLCYRWCNSSLGPLSFRTGAVPVLNRGLKHMAPTFFQRSRRYKRHTIIVDSYMFLISSFVWRCISRCGKGKLILWRRNNASILKRTSLLMRVFSPISIIKNRNSKFKLLSAKSIGSKKSCRYRKSQLC